MRRTGAVLAALAVAGATLSGCSFSIGGGPKAVSKADLQKDISGRLEKEGQKPQSVTCKDDLPAEVGKSVTCEVALTDTNVFEPVVTVSSVDGDTVHYDMAPAVSKQQLEKAVGRLLSDSAGAPVESITCESGLEGKKGAEAHCEVTQGGVTLNRTVDVTNVEGLLMNFTVVPVLVKAQVETSLLDQLENQLGQRPDSADCTSDLEGKPGTSVDCTVVAGEETQVFELTVTSVDGDRINFNYKPKG